MNEKEKEMEQINDIDRLITTYLSGKASTEQRELLEAWVRSDSRQAYYFQKARNIYQGVHPVFDPADIDEERARQKVFRQINGRMSRRALFICYWQRIAAVIVFPLLIAGTYLFLENRKMQKEEVVYQEITSPYGISSHICLPDGSDVWLNGGSVLKYPVRFKKKERTVMLRGEGYFEVQADPENPFVVHTDHTTLYATGTAFNIEAYDEDSITAITLAKGLAKVTLAGHSAVALQPGERICYNRITSQKTVSKTDPYKWYAWKDGVIIFRNDPLEYVFKRLSLIFNVNIVLNDPLLADAPYRATFEGESLDEILRLLELTASIQFFYVERSGNAENYFDKQTIEVRKRKSK